MNSPNLKKLIVALVNNEKFKYNYESIRNLSIYNFYQSFQQIQHEINFNNVMRGVYAGTIDTSKLQNRSIFVPGLKLTNSSRIDTAVFFIYLILFIKEECSYGN